MHSVKHTDSVVSLQSPSLNLHGMLKAFVMLLHRRREGHFSRMLNAMLWQRRLGHLQEILGDCG